MSLSSCLFIVTNSFMSLSHVEGGSKCEGVDLLTDMHKSRTHSWVTNSYMSHDLIYESRTHIHHLMLVLLEGGGKCEGVDLLTHMKESRTRIWVTNAYSPTYVGATRRRRQMRGCWSAYTYKWVTNLYMRDKPKVSNWWRCYLEVAAHTRVLRRSYI